MDAKGNALRVVIANEQSISKQKDIATMFNAPNTVVQQLEGRESLAYFFESPDDYDQDEIFPWDSFLAPALPLTDKDRHGFSSLYTQDHRRRTAEPS